MSQEIASAVRREHLSAFVISAFDELHPAEVFIAAKHVEVMCHSLERVMRGECKRLLITVPPRHLKSIAVAVAFVAWWLGHRPGQSVLVASYGSDLSTKHHRDCRTVMQSAAYRRTFPGTRLARNTQDDLQTTENGGRRAISTGGAATGFGADLIIIDDLIKAADANSETERQKATEYLEQTLLSRLNNKAEGAVVAIQQRLHEDDLAAYLIDKGFEHLCLSAIAESDETFELGFGRTWERRRGEVLFPEREPRPVLDAIRREIGPYAFAAQYLQNPTPLEGNRVRLEWFPEYEQHEVEGVLVIVQSWDCASSIEPAADFSVGMTFGLVPSGDWLLLDICRERLEYPDLKRRVEFEKARWQADQVVIEAADIGRALVDDFWRDPSWRRSLTRTEPRDSKEIRFLSQMGKLEEGLIRLPREAPWLQAFRSELRAFPRGRHDDQVDALGQFLSFVSTGRGERRIFAAQTGTVRLPNGRVPTTVRINPVRRNIVRR